MPCQIILQQVKKKKTKKLDTKTSPSPMREEHLDQILLLRTRLRLLLRAQHSGSAHACQYVVKAR